MEETKYACRCGHALSLHYPSGANECTICDYARTDPNAPSYCLRYDGPLPPARPLHLRVTDLVPPTLTFY